MFTTFLHFLFSVFLSILPPIPQPMRSCVVRRNDEIVQMAQAGYEVHQVPVTLLLMVGFLESHWGCHPRSGGCWGAPIDPQHRLTAGTSNHAARALATSYRVCGTWEGAMNRFRCGLCVCRPSMIVGYTPEYAIHQVERLHERLWLPLPDNFRRNSNRRQTH